MTLWQGLDLEPEGSRFETRFHRRTAVKACLAHAKSVGDKRLLTDAVRKLREGAPPQVMPSSSDRRSELRGSSQNIPRAASERCVNKTN
ncbi:hypothetical protein AVEN_82198-1 [Araneus ventricosus]|uniref:Uncharacterized protein n=1 Tax=Araneus ventricosus TaxID=182803 RepID=A0A4Y2JIN8_ARAVE|nr:hypothetical protein AVEN_82198-1 [Araneus ventricosus]